MHILYPGAARETLSRQDVKVGQVRLLPSVPHLADFAQVLNETNR